MSAIANLLISGDRIVASNSVSQQWTSAQNVSQTLIYPRAGVGSVITYVEVIVEKVVSNTILNDFLN